jgi:hypothetical protein
MYRWYCSLFCDENYCIRFYYIYTIIKDIEDKIIEFDSNKVLAIAGEAADRN